MKVSFNEINNIIKTLPIGYYIGRKLEITLSETEKGSYYEPMHDKIVVSYSMIKDVLDKISETEDIEETVRTLTYHETSHALLTPRELRMTDIINIFEDERIETLLRNFYMNTNFKKFLLRVTGFKGEAPKTVLEAFYQLVRFRIGDPIFLTRVHNLIDQFKNLSQTNTRPTYETSAWRYESAIQTLWSDFSKAYEEKQKEMKRQQDKSNETQNNKDSSENKDNTASKEEVTTSTTSIKLSDTDSPDDDRDTTVGELPENKDDASYSEDFAKEIVNAALNVFVDTELTEKVQTILARISKASARNGSAINAYSGVFDPRSVIRDDYKYFAQQNRNGHVKAYAKTHLTLVIDRSGSFYSSEKIVNKLLYAIHQFEKQNSDFSFDLITCGMSERLEDKNNRQLTTGGGNLLDNKIFDLMKLCQKPGTSNYNIVLFDGDAFSDARRSSAHYENFKAFDLPNLTIISDRDNERHIRKYCKRAKQIISSDYTKELISHTLTALQMLTR